jgi:hypothetical protein
MHASPEEIASFPNFLEIKTCLLNLIGNHFRHFTTNPMMVWSEKDDKDFDERVSEFYKVCESNDWDCDRMVEMWDLDFEEYRERLKSGPRECFMPLYLFFAPVRFDRIVS